MLAIFRKQVLDRQAHPFIGEVLMTQPLSAKIVAYGLFIFALVAALLASQIRFSSVAFVGGRVELTSEPILIKAAIDGRVSNVRFVDGANVKRGDALFDIKSDLPNEATSSPYGGILGEINSRVELENRQNSAALRNSKDEATNIDVQRTQIMRQISVLASEMATQRQRIEVKKRTLETYISLGTFFSELRIDQQRELVYEQEQRLQELQRTEADLRGQDKRLEQARATVIANGAAQASQFEQRVSQLRQAEIEHRSTKSVTVLAPEAGLVARQTVSKEQFVTKGQPILTLVPVAASPVIVLFGKGEAIGQITPAMKVLVRYDAFPYQRFGQFEGTVESVEPISGYLENAVGADSGFRIFVRPKEAGKTDDAVVRTLKPGMTLQASVQLERRSVWGWLIKPIFK